MENKFYIYGHYTVDTDTLFYVGKGSGRRAWRTNGRNPYWHNMVNKHGCVVKMLKEHLTEAEAYQLEIDIIENIGLDNLTNITKGGKGFTSDRAKEIIQYLKEHTNWQQNVTEANRKNANNPEKIRKLSESTTRLSQDAEWKQRNMESRTFYTDPKWKHNISTGVKQKYEDTVYYQKITDINRARGQDTEWRKKQQDIANDMVQTTEWRDKYEIGLTKRMNNPEWKQNHIRSHAKTYTGFVAPDGTIYENVFNLTEFSKTHGLKPKRMRSVHTGVAKSHKGWTKYYPPTNTV